ncbi:MAG: pseudouridine synthase [Bacillota bacterium]
MTRQRLHKIMAQAGLGSRRHCEDIISQGRVKVNGHVVSRPGTQADPELDEIRVDGVLLQEVPRHKTYIMLHKPGGYLTSRRDPRGRRVVMDLLPPLEHPVYPVGRLDYDASGLLLMTNDGDLAFALTHPSREVPKTYLVDVTGHPSRPALTALRRGVTLADGPTAPARVRVVEELENATVLSITIHEGRKHQVKRMCRAVGHEVVRLKRVRLGPLNLGELNPGQWRHLAPREVERLLAAAGLAVKPRDEKEAAPSLPVRPRAQPGTASGTRGPGK